MYLVHLSGVHFPKQHLISLSTAYSADGREAQILPLYYATLFPNNIDVSFAIYAVK